MEGRLLLKAILVFLSIFVYMQNIHVLLLVFQRVKTIFLGIQEYPLATMCNPIIIIYSIDIYIQYFFRLWHGRLWRIDNVYKFFRIKQVGVSLLTHSAIMKPWSHHFFKSGIFLNNSIEILFYVHCWYFYTRKLIT